MTTIPQRETLPILEAGTPIKNATGSLILLHGRGGSAEDILALGSAMTPGGLALLAPQTPRNTWYPLSFLAPRDQNEPFLSASLGQVEAALAHAISNGLKPFQLAFCGFSQGACLATEFVARHPQRYGALIAFTGGLIGPLEQPILLTGDLAGTPVLLSSGDPDPHVPWKRVQQSAELLTQIGGKVTLQRYPNRHHTVLPEEVEAGRKCLGAMSQASALLFDHD